MNLKNLLERRDEIKRIGRLLGAHRIRVFDSVARGDENEASDVDFLVDLEPGRHLLDLGGLQMDLQDLLQSKVDVTTERSLKQRYHERVLSESVEL